MTLCTLLQLERRRAGRDPARERKHRCLRLVHVVSNVRRGQRRGSMARGIGLAGVELSRLHAVCLRVHEERVLIAHLIGIAISFVSENDAFNLPAIEEYLGEAVNCIQPDF